MIDRAPPERIPASPPGGGARLALMAALPMLAACFSYVPTPLDGLAPGVQARFQLTPEGFGRMLNQAAMSGVSIDAVDLGRRSVAGRLVRVDEHAFTLQLRGPGAASFAADLPEIAVEEVARRELDTRRTLAVAAAAAVTGFFLFRGQVGGSTAGPDPPQPEQSRHPLISLPVPFPWIR